MNLLETTKLCKAYNGRVVVDEVSFVLQQQEIVGLLGRNGAGKTTTFRMILGMVVPDNGAVAFHGADITHLPMYKRARKGIGYLSQERSDFQRLTVWQNLQAILETLHLPRSERHRRANQLLDQYGLLKNRNQLAHTLSGGERRKLEIARSLVTEPMLILLDEPFSGVDPIAVEDLQAEVKRLKNEFGKSVLITDHNVEQTLKVCDRALIIDEGRVFREGTPRQIINDPAVRSAYLGNIFRGDEFDDQEAHLSHEHVRRFEQDGYVVVRGVFGTNEAAQMREHYMRLRAEGPKPGDVGGDPASAADPLNQFPRMINMHQWDGATSRWAGDTRLTGLVRQFIGEQPVVNQTMLYFKPPGARGQGMHQDHQYITIEPLVGVWIALEDCDEANGRLMLVPGSQKLAILPVEKADQSLSLMAGQAKLPPSCPLPVGIDMKPGDAVFFSGRTLHGSAPNTSTDRFRRSLICHYVGSRAKHFVPEHGTSMAHLV
jgi:lipopolysaccharide export system ATP-binding protein